MLPRVTSLFNIVRNFERNLYKFIGQPPPELALLHVHESKQVSKKQSFSLKDIIGDGLLLAVPKFRRTIEKRWKRKYGHPDYNLKILEPKTNLIVCQKCGDNHERGRLCGRCYKKIEAETQEIKDKIVQKLGNAPIEQDVIVLYNGDNMPEQPKEFWKGRRIVEMEKERPKWFSKNLLQKTTQQPSTSTDIKPTDLA